MPRAEDDLNRVREKFPWFGRSDDPSSQIEAQELFEYLGSSPREGVLNTLEWNLLYIEGMALFCDLRAYEVAEEAQTKAKGKEPRPPRDWHVFIAGARHLREIRNALLMGFSSQEYIDRLSELNSIPRESR